MGCPGVVRPVPVGDGTGGGTGELNSKPLNVWSGSLSWLHQLYSGAIAPWEASLDGGTFLSS